MEGTSSIRIYIEEGECYMLLGVADHSYSPYSLLG